MKKLLVPVLLLIIITTNVTAQKMYFRGGVGYAIPHNGSTHGLISSSAGINTIVPYNGTYTSTSNSQGYYAELYDINKASFTSGKQGVFGIGVMFNKNVGIETSVNAGLFMEDKKSTSIIRFNKDETTLDVVQKLSTPVILTPALVVQSSGKVKLYARAGLALPVKTTILQNILIRQSLYDEVKNNYITNTFAIIEEYKMKFNAGVSGAIGLKIKAKGGLSIWGEAGMLSMSLYYKTSKTTRYDVNGVSYINPTSSTPFTTTYQFKNTASGNNSTPTFQVPFGNLNFTAGLALDL